MEVLDESGQPINQIEPIASNVPSPLLAAWFKVAYERDPEFKALVDGFIEDIKQIVIDLGDSR